MNRFDLRISLNSVNKGREQSSLSHGTSDLHKIVNHIVCKYMDCRDSRRSSIHLVVRSSFNLTRISSRYPSADILRSLHNVLLNFASKFSFIKRLIGSEYLSLLHDQVLHNHTVEMYV